LLDHYGLLQKEIAPAEYRETNTKVRRHPWARLEVRDACTKCNNGWMSQLEDDVKTLLLNLAGSSVQISQLSEKQEKSLARWAVKTAFMLHRLAYKPIVIPPTAYESFYLRTNEFPHGTFVFAFQDDNTLDNPINCFQSQDWTIHANYGAVIGLTEKLKRTTKISIRIGRLHLLVAYLRDGSLEPVGWFRVHHPLRPTHCRLWLDAGLKKERITARLESSLMLMHVSLGVGSGVSQSDLQSGWRADFEARHEAAFAKVAALDPGL
jgi:hypothetical protein